MKTRTLFLVLCVGFGGLAGSPEAASNLVTNGDFEAGFIPDPMGDSVPAGWVRSVQCKHVEVVGRIPVLGSELLT